MMTHFMEAIRLTAAPAIVPAPRETLAAQRVEVEITLIRWCARRRTANASASSACNQTLRWRYHAEKGVRSWRHRISMLW